MKEMDDSKVFTQYRDIMKPYDPVEGRKYTITHSDLSAQLFVFVSKDYAKDQITEMRDEVEIAWENSAGGYALKDFVVIDNKEVRGNSALRTQIFYDEMPVALQAMRLADRFLYEKYSFLDKARVSIRFVSDIPRYNRIYDFGCIGDYRS